MNTTRRQPSASKWYSILAGLGLAGLLLFSTASLAQAQDGPRIIRPQVVAGVHQNWRTWSPTSRKWLDNHTSWMPSLKFAYDGPVTAGSQFIVEFTKPNGQLWWVLNCRTDEVQPGYWSSTETPRDTSSANEKKYSNGIGVFGFKIRLKNELSGQNKVIHSGKFKVGRASNFNGTPVTKNQYDYYVDHDWALPFAYLWFNEDEVIKSSKLVCAIWLKGVVHSPDLAGYVIYQGKTIASTKEMGSTGTTELEIGTINTGPGRPQWDLVQFEWFTVARTSFGEAEGNDKVFNLEMNPGDYEIKVLRHGKLSRQIKFTVGADGKIVRNDFNSQNKLNTARLVLPVKILGTGDGTWNKIAWKTEAFYGNPVPGFVAP